MKIVTVVLKNGCSLVMEGVTDKDAVSIKECFTDGQTEFLTLIGGRPKRTMDVRYSEVAALVTMPDENEALN